MLLLIRCILLFPLWDSVIFLFFCMYLCVHSSFSIILKGRESWLLCFFLLMSCECCVTPPQGATGLSAVSDCGIS